MSALFGNKTDPCHSIPLQAFHDDFHNGRGNCLSSRLWPDHYVLNIRITCPVADGPPHTQDPLRLFNRYHKAVTAGNDPPTAAAAVSDPEAVPGVNHT